MNCDSKIRKGSGEKTREYYAISTPLDSRLDQIECDQTFPDVPN